MDSVVEFLQMTLIPKEPNATLMRACDADVKIRMALEE